MQVCVSGRVHVDDDRHVQESRLQFARTQMRRAMNEALDR
jgi:hypothetical protein